MLLYNRNANIDGFSNAINILLANFWAIGHNKISGKCW